MTIRQHPPLFAQQKGDASSIARRRGGTPFRTYDAYSGIEVQL